MAYDKIDCIFNDLLVLDMALSGIDLKLSSVVHSKSFSLVMLACLMGYALLKSASRVYGDIFQTIFVFGTLLALYLNRKVIFKDKMFIFLFLSVVIQILSWINASIKIPQLAQDTPNIGKLGNLFFFIFIAYWLKGCTKSVYILWIVMLVGFILSFYIHSDDFYQELISGAYGSRIDFNVNNAQHPALWSGVAFILLTYFIAKHIYKALDKKKVAHNIKIIIILFPLFLFFSFIIFATQTRQVFLAIIISCTVGPIAYVFLQKNRPSLKATISIFMVFIVMVYSAIHIPSLEKRTLREFSTYTAFISGDIDKVPYTSSGIRINIWYEAIGWIKERPILGSGRNVRDDVISLSERLPKKIIDRIDHLHNSFIEITISYGIIGMILILSVFYWLLHSTSKINLIGEFNEIRLLSLIFLIYWIIVNNFESYLFSSTGLLVHNIMFGSLYTFYFTQQLDKERNETII